MKINLNKKEKEFIINECLRWLNSTKKRDAETEGKVTIKNYKEFKYSDFSGEYGLPDEKDYNIIISLLDKLVQKF